MWGRAACVVLLVACAQAREGTGDGPFAIDSSDSGTSMGSQCPPGFLATDVSTANQVTCNAIDGSVKQALDDNCSVYAGAQDGCDGCANPPNKWGYTGGARCMNGAGANNTCTMQSLGGAMVQLFGLNFDGDVDGNDKLHGGLHCVAPEPTAGLAPCKANEWVSGKIGSSWACSSIAGAVTDYVSKNCSLYLGWQDGCDGCTNQPNKWGYTSGAMCMNGAGGDNTCGQFALSGQMVRQFGLNFDGDVDGNDKLHVGLNCAAPEPAMIIEQTGCPANRFVTAAMSDGSFRCESPAPAIAAYFMAHCTLYLGWRDGCDGCTTPPAKWGRVRTGACQLGIGGDNTCTTFTLGGKQVAAFGLNTDGDVDGNDTLYVGFQCP